MNTLTKVEVSVDEADDAVELRAQDLLQFLHDDNKAVAELLFQFTQVESDEDKREIFDAIKDGLSQHAQIVEEYLFPTLIDNAEEGDEEETEKLVAVAEAGNYVVAVLLDELEDTEVDDEFFEAKMTILCELTRLQVKREEKEMFEKLRSAEVDLDELGEGAADLKTNLEESAINIKAKAKPKAQAKKSSKPAAKNKKGGKNATTAKANSRKSSEKKPVAKKADERKRSSKTASSKKKSR